MKWKRLVVVVGLLMSGCSGKGWSMNLSYDPLLPGAQTTRSYSNSAIEDRRTGRYVGQHAAQDEQNVRVKESYFPQWFK